MQLPKGPGIGVVNYVIAAPDGLDPILPFTISNPGPSQLLEGIDEIRKVVAPFSDEDHRELQRFAGFVYRFVLKGRLDYEWMGCARIFAHHLGVRRRRGLKDVRVCASVFQQAVVACFSPDGADDLPEGMAEPAPQGRAFVGREGYDVLRLKSQLDYLNGQIVQHGALQ